MIVQNIKTKKLYKFNDDEMTITRLEYKSYRKYKDALGYPVKEKTYRMIGKHIPITNETLNQLFQAYD